MGIEVSKSEIVARVLSGHNCGQCVLGAFAEAAGYDTDETDRFAAGFGGGLQLAQTCGAVAGGICALGLLSEDNDEACERIAEFTKRFKEEYGTCMCKELLGFDLTEPGVYEANRDGALVEKCPMYIKTAIEIVSDVLDL